MALTTEEFLSSTSTVINTDYLHDDIQFLIDENLRTIAIPRDGVVLGVVGDKNTNRVNFQMIRYYNGIDMSEYICRVHYINASGDGNYYTVDDLTIEEDTMLFTWLVDLPATVSVGDVQFVVKMVKLDGDVITNSFSTTIASAKVLEGIDVVESVSPEAVQDLLEHIKADTDAYVEQAVEDALNNNDTYKEAIDTAVDGAIDAAMEEVKDDILATADERYINVSEDAYYIKSSRTPIGPQTIGEVCLNGNVDYLPPNRIYSFEILDDDVLSNSNLPCNVGTIILFSPAGHSAAGDVQMVIDDTGCIYTRAKQGAIWLDWVQSGGSGTSSTSMYVQDSELIINN